MNGETVHIAPSSGSYDVIVSASALCNAGEHLAPLLPSRSAFIITDSICTCVN